MNSNLLARGNEARCTIGTVNAVEFFVTLTASLVFLVTLGVAHWQIVVALGLGGLLAAPLGGFFVRHVKARWLLLVVGLLVTGLSLRTLYLHFSG